MTLSQYLARHSTGADLARRLGVNPSTITRWANGQLVPSLAWCARIAEATNGRVTVRDFYKQVATG